MQFLSVRPDLHNVKLFGVCIKGEHGEAQPFSPRLLSATRTDATVRHHGVSVARREAQFTTRSFKEFP